MPSPHAAAAAAAATTTIPTTTTTTTTTTLSRTVTHVPHWKVIGDTVSGCCYPLIIVDLNGNAAKGAPGRIRLALDMLRRFFDAEATAARVHAVEGAAATEKQSTEEEGGNVEAEEGEGGRSSPTTRMADGGESGEAEGAWARAGEWDEEEGGAALAWAGAEAKSTALTAGDVSAAALATAAAAEMDERIRRLEEEAAMELAADGLEANPGGVPTVATFHGHGVKGLQRMKGSKSTGALPGGPGGGGGSGSRARSKGSPNGSPKKKGFPAPGDSPNRKVRRRVMEEGNTAQRFAAAQDIFRPFDNRPKPGLPKFTTLLKAAPQPPKRDLDKERRDAKQAEAEENAAAVAEAQIRSLGFIYCSEDNKARHFRRSMAPYPACRDELIDWLEQIKLNPMAPEVAKAQRLVAGASLVAKMKDEDAFTLGQLTDPTPNPKALTLTWTLFRRIGSRWVALGRTARPCSFQLY